MKIIPSVVNLDDLESDHNTKLISPIMKIEEGATKDFAVQCESICAVWRLKIGKTFAQDKMIKEARSQSNRLGPHAKKGKKLLNCFIPRAQSKLLSDRLLEHLPRIQFKSKEILKISKTISHRRTLKRFKPKKINSQELSMEIVTKDDNTDSFRSQAQNWIRNQGSQRSRC